MIYSVSVIKIFIASFFKTPQKIPLKRGGKKPHNLSRTKISNSDSSKVQAGNQSEQRELGGTRNYIRYQKRAAAILLSPNVAIVRIYGPSVARSSFFPPSKGKPQIQIFGNQFKLKTITHFW